MASVPVIFNPAAGSAQSAGLLSVIDSAFHTRGLDPAFLIVQRRTAIPELVETALRWGAETVVAAGGDGTVHKVAAALANRAAVLGIVPVGTLNHFARDVGVPPGLEDAVGVIAAGETIEVDCGEVNGQAFVNNASFGFYPLTVVERERIRRKAGSKWLAMAWSVLKVSWRYPTWKVTLRGNGTERKLATPFIFVGNNEYIVQGFSIGERRTIRGGYLHVCAGIRTGRRGLLRLALRALAGKLEEGRDVEILKGREVVIETRRKRVRLALDGEVKIFSPPLRFVIRPAALRVLSSLKAAAPPAEESRNAQDRTPV